MGFFGRLLYKLSNFMRGRYGIDALNIPVLIVSCICTLLGTVFWSGILRLIGLLLIVWLVFRVLSKNHTARRRELDAYYNLKNSFSSMAQKIERRKYKRYFKCPKCKVKLSVPRGKGKIQITCRKCGHKFIRKT